MVVVVVVCGGGGCMWWWWWWWLNAHSRHKCTDAADTQEQTRKHIYTRTHMIIV